jgi:hypothetical protein
MRRFMAVLVVAAIGLTTAAPATADRGAGAWREKECRYARADGEPGYSQSEIRRVIECAVGKWSVVGGVPMAICIAAHESGLDPSAYNPNGHGGLFQQDTGAWPGRRATWEPPTWDKGLHPSVFNARANTVVSIRMAHADGDWDQWAVDHFCD